MTDTKTIFDNLDRELATVAVTTTALDAFLARCQAKVETDYRATFAGGVIPDHMARFAPKLTLEIGKRYARIVSESGPQRSAFGFIDLQNGNLLKCAGWKGPAKNFARGNIFDDAGGLGRVRWTGIG